MDAETFLKALGERHSLALDLESHFQGKFTDELFDLLDDDEDDEWAQGVKDWLVDRWGSRSAVD